MEEPDAISHATGMPLQTGPDCCRLCGGKTDTMFQLKVLGKYDVAYRRCADCQSLQSEHPYWLDEAYRLNLALLDTGAAQRNLKNLAVTWLLAQSFGYRTITDIGGGDGLLCRLLRDYGLDCYVRDKYAPPTYAQGFGEPDTLKPDIVVAFEVFEHFASVAAEIDSVFSKTPRAVLISTETYSNQDSHWWYLSPETGQHIFFYSKTALEQIAARFGYRLIRMREYSLFLARSESTSKLKIAAFKFTLKKALPLVRAALILRNPTGVQRDYENLRSALVPEK